MLSNPIYFSYIRKMNQKTKSKIGFSIIFSNLVSSNTLPNVIDPEFIFHDDEI